MPSGLKRKLSAIRDYLRLTQQARAERRRGSCEMQRKLLYNKRHYDDPTNYGPRCWTLREQHRIETIGSLMPAEVKTVLDIGSGGGEIVEALRNGGLRVVATDCSAATLSLYGGDRVLCESKDLPFDNQSFDMVTCTEVLEHLDDTRYAGTVREIGRIAGTYALISVPNGEDLHQTMVKCRACRHLYTLYGHVRRLDRAVMQDLLPGFRVIQEALGDVDLLYNRVLLWTRQHLGRRWAYWEHAVCPVCGTKPRHPGRRNMIVLACDFVNNRIPWRPQWRTPLYVLYRRTS